MFNGKTSNRFMITKNKRKNRKIVKNTEHKNFQEKSKFIRNKLQIMNDIRKNVCTRVEGRN